MRIAILGAADNYYVQDLVRAAGEVCPSAEVLVLKYMDLRVGVGERLADEVLPYGLGNDCDACPSRSRASPQARGIEAARDARSPAWVDAVIVRSMPIGTLEQVIFRMDCLQTWEARGVRVINPPRSLELAIDKWLCSDRLWRADLKVPPTVCCQSRAAAMEAFELLGGDVLIKPLFGGEGRGILRVQDKDLAWRTFGTLQQLGQVLYVQKFLEHFGYDIRVLYIGEQVYCIRRSAQPGAWRTNLAQGSRAEAGELTDELACVALRCKEVVGGSVVGVDLLPCRDGSVYVLEVNAVPGWKGLGAALRVDVARDVIAHACASILQA